MNIFIFVTYHRGLGVVVRIYIEQKVPSSSYGSYIPFHSEYWQTGTLAILREINRA